MDFVSYGWYFTFKQGFVYLGLIYLQGFTTMQKVNPWKTYIKLSAVLMVSYSSSFLQNKLENLAGKHSDVLQNLSPSVRKRIDILWKIQYASAAQWLTTYSNNTLETDGPDVDRYKKLKLRTRSLTLKVASESATVVTSILKFEREFSSELQSLVPILSSNSQAEPYLTHLA